MESEGRQLRRSAGHAQFMPSTWASAGKDGDGDGKADIWNPHDAIRSQGNYMCNLASQVETAKKSGKLTGDTLELTLAAYNAGLGSVLRYGMVPPFEETINYVRRIKELAATKYTATGTAEGGTVGSLEPKLTVSGGIVSTAGITPDTRYPWGQCTWWAATRRADIGKPIPGVGQRRHMGRFRGVGRLHGGRLPIRRQCHRVPTGSIGRVR